MKSIFLTSTSLVTLTSLTSVAAANINLIPVPPNTPSELVNMQEVKQNISVATDVIVGNDRDEHGCIGSAGYSWDEKTQACVRPWEQKINPELRVLCPTMVGIVYDEKTNTCVHEYTPTPIENKRDEHGCIIGSTGESWDEQRQQCIPFSVEAVYNWANENKLTTLTYEDFDRHSGPVSREVVAAILARAKEAKIISPAPTNLGAKDFSDSQYISPGLEKYVKTMQEYGVFRGENGKFEPRHYITYFEAITVISRAFMAGEVYSIADAEETIKNLHFPILDKNKEDMDRWISGKEFFYILKTVSQEYNNQKILYPDTEMNMKK